MSFVSINLSVSLDYRAAVTKIQFIRKSLYVKCDIG